MIIEFLGYIPFENKLETIGEKIIYYRRLTAMILAPRLFSGDSNPKG